MAASSRRSPGIGSEAWKCCCRSGIRRRLFCTEAFRFGWRSGQSSGGRSPQAFVDVSMDPVPPSASAQRAALLSESRTTPAWARPLSTPYWWRIRITNSTDSKSILSHILRSLRPGGRLVVVDRGPRSADGKHVRSHPTSTKYPSRESRVSLFEGDSRIVSTDHDFIDRPGDHWWLIVAQKPQ